MERKDVLLRMLMMIMVMIMMVMALITTERGREEEIDGYIDR